MKNKTGAATQLSLAILLTLTAISTAFLLNSMYDNYNVSASMILKTDYQMESAIIMHLQGIRTGRVFEDALEDSVFTRQLSPGIVLSLTYNQVASETYKFNVNVTGQGIDRSITAYGNLNNPDKISFTSER